MDPEILIVLEKFEQRVSDGQFRTFSIKMNGMGMDIVPEGEPVHSILLADLVLLQTLQIFFYDVDAITYLSNDYNTLKSLLNAHACLARMNQKKHSLET